MSKLHLRLDGVPSNAKITVTSEDGHAVELELPSKRRVLESGSARDDLHAAWCAVPSLFQAEDAPRRLERLEQLCRVVTTLLGWEPGEVDMDLYGPLGAAAKLLPKYPLHKRSSPVATQLQAYAGESAAGDQGSAMKLPKHINLRIVHQPHATSYETVEQWLKTVDTFDAVDIEPEDRAEMLRTGEVWEIQWYPNSPVGSHSVAAATLERALELANDPGYR